MYHAEVLGLAKTWLQRCTCVSRRILKKEDYPTRLINLAELKKLYTIDTKEWRYRGDRELEEKRLEKKVNLIDTSDLDWSELEHKQYVTLSHKWGGTVKPVRLTRGTEKAYREGVHLRDLSQTYQDAIQFALGLDDRIHYIWIDSLCIVQGDEDDWLKESDRMQDVYRNSFLNISATAAEHSGEGLFSHRDPQHLWDEVVHLDVDGLQGAEEIRQDSREKITAVHNQDSNTTVIGDPAAGPKYLQLTKVQSCLLVDVNWESLVNQAPVQKRGWVVQERLLAPRVLHFCRGRIAWECAEFDDIEGHGPSIPNYRLLEDKICEGIPIKGMQPGQHGKRLRDDRLRGVVGLTDLDESGPESGIIHSLELWSRIVEMYCKTELTKDRDKLIAFSGIAHLMANTLAESGKEGDRIQYIAGLWNVHLISQMLWRVEPVYRGDSDARADTIEFVSRRPTIYRAPSFSWASVDAQFGNGITCGHVLDPDAVLVEVSQDDDVFVKAPQDVDDSGSEPETEPWKKSVRVQLKTKNEFGLVTSGHIRLWAWLHHVKLRRDGTHYYWSLAVNNESSTELDKNEKSGKENFNVYLDCPNDDDRESRLILSDDIYCIPMAYVPNSGSNDITCLLLEKASGDDNRIRNWPDEYRQWTFKRIGYTKLTTTFDNFTWEYISNFRPYQKASDKFYDERSGRHLVCII